MAFYLKLLEIYNIYGLFIFYVVRYITHRAIRPRRPPARGRSAPAAARLATRRAVLCYYNSELCCPFPFPAAILPPCNAVKAT